MRFLGGFFLARAATRLRMGHSSDYTMARILPRPFERNPGGTLFGHLIRAQPA